MKLNLGCGKDVRVGYENVDRRSFQNSIAPIIQVDLSKLPWPWPDASADEIMMLDFLEHFPYSMTEKILAEVWRVLKPGGKLIVQVPDLDHCSRVAAFRPPFMCNRCGWEYPENDVRANFFICEKCQQPWLTCATAAVHRLYGGQDYEGNWHFTAFTEILLRRMLEQSGFGDVVSVINNENGETLWQNWNFRLEALKKEDIWGEQ